MRDRSLWTTVVFSPADSRVPYSTMVHHSKQAPLMWMWHSGISKYASRLGCLRGSSPLHTTYTMPIVLLRRSLAAPYMTFLQLSNLKIGNRAAAGTSQSVGKPVFCGGANRLHHSEALSVCPHSQRPIHSIEVMALFLNPRVFITNLCELFLGFSMTIVDLGCCCWPFAFSYHHCHIPSCHH